jgi:hypothetical protein
MKADRPADGEPAHVSGFRDFLSFRLNSGCLAPDERRRGKLLAEKNKRRQKLRAAGDFAAVIRTGSARSPASRATARQPVKSGQKAG